MSKPNDKLPKWVQESAVRYSHENFNHVPAEVNFAATDGFLAGAQLILDRLKATEVNDVPGLGSPEWAEGWGQGRASVRREVLGDE